MTLRSFITSLNQQIGIPLPDDWNTIIDEITLSQCVLERLDEYFFQVSDEIGTITLNDKEVQ